MPRVPVLEGPQVQAEGPKPIYQDRNYAQAYQSGNISPEINKLGAGIDRAYRIAHEKAVDTDVANALTQMQHEGTTFMQGSAEDGGTPGYLSTRGKDATAQAGALMENLSKAQQKIVDGLASDDAKRKFSQKSGAMLEGYRSQAEGHASQQFRVAQLSALAGQEAVNLTATATNYTDDKQAAVLAQQMADQYRSLTDSPEEAAAKSAEFQQKQAAARLSMYIAKNDYKGAQTLYATQEKILGADAPRFQHTITLLQEKQEGEALGFSTVGATKSADSGLFDVNKAISDYNALPQEKRTEQADQAFHKHLALATSSNTALTSTTFGKGFTAFNVHHTLNDIDAPTTQWIKNNDPEGWHRLEQMQQSYWEHAEAKRNERANQAPTTAQIQAFGQLTWDMAGDQSGKYGKMTPDELLRGYTPGVVLTSRQYQQALDKLSDIHGNSSKPVPDDQRAISMARQQFRSRFSEDALPEDTGKWNEQQWSAWNSVQENVETQNRAFRTNHPKELPDAKMVQGWIDESLSKGFTDGNGWFGTNFRNKPMSRVEFDSDPRFLGKEFKPVDEDGKSLPAPGDLSKEAQAAAQVFLVKHGKQGTTQEVQDLIRKAAVKARAKRLGATPENISQGILSLAPAQEK